MNIEISLSNHRASTTKPGKKPGKKRIRNFTLDDRAAHRAFETGRRDGFKEGLVVSTSRVPEIIFPGPFLPNQ